MFPCFKKEFSIIDSSFLEEYYVLFLKLYQDGITDDNTFEVVILMTQHYQVNKYVLEALVDSNEIIPYDEIVEKK